MLSPSLSFVSGARLKHLCVLLFFLFTIGMTLSAQCPNIVWADEFNGSSLDLTKWEPQIGDGCNIGLCGWGNNELQYYKAENAEVSNGTLKIIAKEERVRSKKYTSARLRTINQGDWTYGRFEASIKLPFGQGIWPAFWMLATDEVYGGWPQSGEIDIMEMVGHEPATVHGTIHYGDPWPDNQNQGNSYKLHNGIFNDQFHEFAIEWEPGEIRWYVDDYLYLAKTDQDVSPYNWPFDQRFHFLLNVAVGGNWPGNPDESTIFPQTMEVEYVRVYDGFFPHLTGNRVVAYQAQGEVYIVGNAPGGSAFTWTVPAGATIVSGQGTSSITVDWGTAGGDVIVEVNTGCSTEQIVLNVVVEPNFVEEFSFENFDEPANMTFVSATGTLTEDVANPAPNAVNGSALSGQYVRNAAQQYDVLQYSTTMIPDAGKYANNEKKFFLDVYTAAPPGTLVLLQLEDSGSATSSNYPTGRHSRYEAFTSVQNQWERLEFTLLDRPDGNVPDDAVDRVLFLFASNSFTGDTYYWDNFDSYAAEGAPPSNNPPSVSITAPADGTTYTSLQTITIQADASDNDGSVTQVEFFAGGSSIGVDNASPYSIDWAIPAFGSYELTAEATDNDGAATLSAPVGITAQDNGGGTPAYCSAGGNANNEWIANVAIGSFSNASGSAGYSDFTGTTISLATGSHALTLTPDYKGPNRAEYWRIWIDYNVDGDFDDAGELAFDAGNAQSGAVSGSLTIPGSAAGLTTRLRIAMKRDAAPGPCESFNRGEVEDYTLSVSGSALRSIDLSHSAKAGKLTLFPNPADSRLSLRNRTASTLTSVVVYDSNGCARLRLNSPVKKGELISLDISTLKSGVYWLQGIGADGTLQQWRFVKM